ncbi:MAG: hypothetical protein WC812_01915 [Candidatus Pacearchaeota archaeon]|jgi:hypothetical protein
MKEKVSEDLGEEIISKLKELILILEKRINKNGNECTSAYCNNNRISRKA